MYGLSLSHRPATRYLGKSYSSDYNPAQNSVRVLFDAAVELRCSRPSTKITMASTFR